MSEVGISKSGLSHLKQILYLRDNLDLYTFLKEGDKKKNTPAPLAPETSQGLEDPQKGWTLTLRGLVQQFNQNPEDVRKAAALFGIQIDPNHPQLKAYQFSEAKLTDLNNSSDLKNILKSVDAIPISPTDKIILRQILYIRNLLDYDIFLKEGDKKKNIPAPLSIETARGLDDPAKGWTLTLRGLVQDFNQNTDDVRSAAKLFGIQVDPNKPQIKAYQFSETEKGLNILDDSTDLKEALCTIDPAECPKEATPALLPEIPLVAPPTSSTNINEFLRALFKEIIDRLEEKEYKSKKKPLDKLLKLMQQDPGILADFADPKNQAAVVEIFLHVLEDNQLSFILESKDPQKLLKFLKDKSEEIYKKASEKLKDFEFLSCEYFISRYNYYKTMGNFIGSKDFALDNHKKLETHLSYCKVREAITKIRNENISTQKLEILLEILPRITEELPKLPSNDQERALSDISISLASLDFYSKEECARVEKEILPKLSDPLFEIIMKKLEAEIKTCGIAALSGTRLYQHVSEWMGKEASPEKIQKLFSKKVPEDNRKGIEEAFAALFDTFNAEPYNKECPSCRISVLESLISFAVNFASQSSDKLKTIAQAYRKYVDMKINIEKATNPPVGERVKILGLFEGSGILDRAVPHLLEFLSGNGASFKEILIKILKDKDLAKELLNILNTNDYEKVQQFFSDLRKEGNLAANDPREKCLPPKNGEKDDRESLKFIGVDCDKYEMLQKISSPYARVRMLIDAENKSYENAFFYTSNSLAKASFLIKFSLSKEGEIMGNVLIKNASPSISNQAMKKLTDRIINIIKKIDYRYVSPGKPIAIEYFFSF